MSQQQQHPHRHESSSSRSNPSFRDGGGGGYSNNQQQYNNNNNRYNNNNGYGGRQQHYQQSDSTHKRSYNDNDRQSYQQQQQRGGYSKGGDDGDFNRSSSSSNYYHNNRRNDQQYHDKGNYRNYDDNKTVSMNQSHHNNSSSSDSFKYKGNYNRRDDSVNRAQSEQSNKRKPVDNNSSSRGVQEQHVKRVKIEEKASNNSKSTIINPSPNNLLEEKKKSEERLLEQLNNETLLMQNNDEEQVAAKREERRKRIKEMEALILSQQTQSNDKTVEDIVENETVEDDSDNETVEPITEYNVSDERVLFIHQIEKQREKGIKSDSTTDTTNKVTSLYEEDEKSTTPIIDMFADSPDTLVQILNANNSNLNHNNNSSTELYDDVEGYYRYNIGEVVNQRYKIEQFLGQGVFSCVIKASDLDTNQMFAIKIIRNIESMKKAGLKELDLLSKINEKDTTTQEYNIIKMVESFTYRNHLCIVFELLEMNLRDVLKNYGSAKGRQQSIGISIQACKIYTKQLIYALKYIQECNIIHADIKPDNILLDHSHQFVKLSDFGSACHVSENIITPYLVSRFYRAPEIILGMKYSYPIDMWSIACTIYELYTGKILFTSQNNNDHLRLVMELKGKFPNRVLKKCAFRENHFEGEAFLFREFDKLAKKIKVSKIYFQRNTRDLKAMLLNSMLQNHQHDENSSEQAVLEEKKQVMLLHDFLDKALALDPSKRLSISDALQHPFVNNE